MKLKGEIKGIGYIKIQKIQAILPRILNVVLLLFLVLSSFFLDGYFPNPLSEENAKQGNDSKDHQVGGAGDEPDGQVYNAFSQTFQRIGEAGGDPFPEGRFLHGGILLNFFNA